jgi:hypothetical protein
MKRNSTSNIAQQKTSKLAELKIPLMVIVAALFFFGAGSSTASHAQTPYYQGKTSRLLSARLRGTFTIFTRALSPSTCRSISRATPI